MIVSAGFADPWVGQTLPSAMNRFSTPQTRWSAAIDAVIGARAHAGPADQVGVALDGQDVLGAGGFEDGLDDRSRVLHVEPVVLAARVGELRDRHASHVLLLGERHTVLGLRQQLVEHPDRAPVVVVAHVLAQRPSAVPLGDHVLGPADRQR